jgi:methylglutaconyl-CoA hydratase
MAPPAVDVQVGAEVARVSLARPEVRNAFDGATVAELRLAVDTLSRRDDVRVIVLGGQGPVFSAGADLAWMTTVGGFTAEENLQDALALADLLDALDRSPKAVVARVHGAALGGGAGLVAAADVAVAASETVFGFTEVRLGLVPAVISPWVLRKIGVSAARELFLTGERFGADRALSIGLVHRVVPEGELDSVVDERVAQLLQAAPGALAAAKALVRDVAGLGPAEVRKTTAERIAARRTSEEGREGLNAFTEKRKPGWAR